MMRGLVVAFVVASTAAVAAGCGGAGGGTSKSEATTSTATTTVSPVGEAVLKGLLLNGDQVNPIMGVNGMRVTQRRTELTDDRDIMEPRECLPIDGAGQLAVYENTGYLDVRGQTLRDGEHFDHYVDQVVVLFPTAKRAATFIDIEAELWPSCHSYTHTQSGSEWAPGPISMENGVLSVITKQQNAGNDNAWVCGRALTARNNVVIDVNTCSSDPKDSAVIVAEQIAEQVPMEPG